MATIRRAEQRDAEAVLALVAELGRPVEPEHADALQMVFLDHLAYDDAHVFVAEADGAVVGLASVWLRPRLNRPTLEGWVPDLYVDPEHRRQGVGRALLDGCAAEARRRGCHELVLDAPARGVEASAFLKGCGLTQAGRHCELTL